MIEFFRKYNAIRATDSGPSWRELDEETLIREVVRLCEIVVIGWNRDAGRDATDDERCGNSWMLNEVTAEVTRRANLPGASAAIVAAYLVRCRKG